MRYSKESDLIEREKENPENDIKVDVTDENSEIFNSLLNDQSETLDWEKSLKLMRYPNAPPAINLDNIDEIAPLEENICPIDVDVRDSLSNHYSILTAYYNKETGKWYEAKRASHPFISVNKEKLLTLIQL